MSSTWNCHIIAIPAADIRHNTSYCPISTRAPCNLLLLSCMPIVAKVAGLQSDLLTASLTQKLGMTLS